MKRSDIGWFDAWIGAATGLSGFWRKERPAAHFRTAAQATALTARMILGLLQDHPGVSTVVDIGAGDGRMLSVLNGMDPGLRLIGIDMRPLGADRAQSAGIVWLQREWDVVGQCWVSSTGGPSRPLLEPPDGSEGQWMVICAEWLDDLPCVIAEMTADGWREVLVDDDGDESVGGLVAVQEAQWLDRWWPAATPGVRAESGRIRDAAWAAAVSTLRDTGGLALMIDYGHLRNTRPAAGTLTGYRDGLQVPPRPSTEINLTAHVAVDAIAAAGVRAGAATEFLINQRTAVGRFLTMPATDPRADTLGRLQEQGERRLLAETLGDHWWLLQSVPAPAPGHPAA